MTCWGRARGSCGPRTGIRLCGHDAASSSTSSFSFSSASLLLLEPPPAGSPPDGRAANSRNSSSRSTQQPLRRLWRQTVALAAAAAALRRRRAKSASRAPPSLTTPLVWPSERAITRAAGVHTFHWDARLRRCARGKRTARSAPRRPGCISFSLFFCFNSLSFSLSLQVHCCCSRKG